MDSQVTLFHLMFGEQALTARDNASETLTRWAGLFEDWLEEHGNAQPRGQWHSLKVWSEFLPLLRKPPWEAERERRAALTSIGCAAKAKQKTASAER